MNRDSRRCEACHASCSTCSGPLAGDCLTCRSGLFLDSGHCVPCCASSSSSSESFSGPTLAPEFTDCCVCLAAAGPCASSLAIDRPRSVESALLREQRPFAFLRPEASLDNHRRVNTTSSTSFSPLSLLLNQTATYLVLVALVLALVLVFVGRRRRWWLSSSATGSKRKRLPGSSYNIDYQRLLNVNYSASSSSRRHNRLKSSSRQRLEGIGEEAEGGGVEYEEYEVDDLVDGEEGDEEVMLFART